MTARERRSISIDSVEQLQRVGAAFFDEPQPKDPLLLPRSLANNLSAHEAKVLWQFRKRLAEVFGQPHSHPFFRERYLPGEDPDAALLRMLKRHQWMVSLTDEEAIESLARRR